MIRLLVSSNVDILKKRISQDTFHIPIPEQQFILAPIVFKRVLFKGASINAPIKIWIEYLKKFFCCMTNMILMN